MPKQAKMLEKEKSKVAKTQSINREILLSSKI